MNKSPLVSVIITTKNEAPNIGRFFKSLKMQSYPNLELILVDNNSSDKTKTIARKFTENIYNFGPERSAQRNYGAAHSKGGWLLFLDADMELSKDVIKDCLNVLSKSDAKILTIPETTVGNSFLGRVRRFERGMYVNEVDYEVPRMFDRKLFFQYDGYDEELTGPEDYDLPYRMGDKNKIVRSNEYLYHHEEKLTLGRLLWKKFYYAKKGALYAIKHPMLVKKQGTILFRKVYLRNWRRFVKHPILGISFVFIRFLETIWAVAGFISAVGLVKFIKVFLQMFK